MKSDAKLEMKFEKALERLEEIVNGLEDGTLSLDDALKKYEEGVKLARVMTQQLHEADKKIEILTKSLGGELKAIPFDAESEDEPDGSNDSAAARPRIRKKA